MKKKLKDKRFMSYNLYIGRLAQLVRALRSHRRGRGFKSLTGYEIIFI